MKRFIIALVILILGTCNALADDIGLIEMPGDYTKLSKERISSPELSNEINKILPGAEDVWVQYKNDDIGVSAYAGKVAINGSALGKMGKEDFISSISRQLGDKYVKKYTYEGSTATYKVYDKGPVIYLRMLSSFLDYDGYNYTAERFIFFYNTNYRLDLVFSGRTIDYDNEKVKIEEYVDKFVNKLIKMYPDGITFGR